MDRSSQDHGRPFTLARRCFEPYHQLTNQNNGPPFLGRHRFFPAQSWWSSNLVLRIACRWVPPHSWRVDVHSTQAHRFPIVTVPVVRISLYSTSQSTAIQAQPLTLTAARNQKRKRARYAFPNAGVCGPGARGAFPDVVVFSAPVSASSCVDNTNIIALV